MTIRWYLVEIIAITCIHVCIGNLLNSSSYFSLFAYQTTRLCVIKLLSGLSKVE